jgi:multidrug resistance efflux pump
MPALQDVSTLEARAAHLRHVWQHAKAAAHAADAELNADDGLTPEKREAAYARYRRLDALRFFAFDKYKEAVRALRDAVDARDGRVAWAIYRRDVIGNIVRIGAGRATSAEEAVAEFRETCSLADWYWQMWAERA